MLYFTMFLFPEIVLGLFMLLFGVTKFELRASVLLGTGALPLEPGSQPEITVLYFLFWQ
jgi:ABC-type phosphate transport system permease subunit